MYRLSKAVKNGTVVTLRGDKFIRCTNLNKNIKVAGVYSTGEERRTIILDTGEHVKSFHPSGVVTYGPINIGVEHGEATT